MIKALLLLAVLLPCTLVLLKKFVSTQIEDFKIDYSDAAGKVVIITGANSGLGYETALALAGANAVVVLGCRSGRKCEEAKAAITSVHPSAHVDSLVLDLSSFSSIRNFVTSFNSKYSKLDVLVNNAGVMAIPEREVTADGLEMQIGTNHFGHFLLTSLLYPSLSQDGRIINHSSGAHNMADPAFPQSDLQGSKHYSPWKAYGNSKLANLLFTFQLNKELRSIGNPKNIRVIAVHPGYSSTNLQTDRFPMWRLLGTFAMTAREGALSQIYGTTSPHLALFLSVS